MSLVDALIEEKNSLFKRIEAIDLLLKSYEVKGKESKKTEQNNDKSEKETLSSLSDANRFLFTLKKHQRFMKVREIAQYIADQLDEDIDKWVSKMSRKTRVLKNANKIAKHQVGTKNTNVFWGSPNWIDENKNILDKYMYSNKNVDNLKSDNLFDI